MFSSIIIFIITMKALILEIVDYYKMKCHIIKYCDGEC